MCAVGNCETEHVCLRFLKILFENGASVNTLDDSRLTPLHYAAIACCPDAMNFLIQRGADVTARSTTGQTALQLLGKNSHKLEFQMALELLLECGCSINESDTLKQTILHYITLSNKCSRKAVETVLAAGAAINAKAISGLTPLHQCLTKSIFHAVDDYEEGEEDKFDVSDVITALVERGAEINATDSCSLTPLHYALRYEEKSESVGTLIPFGSRRQRKNKTGETALH